MKNIFVVFTVSALFFGVADSVFSQTDQSASSQDDGKRWSIGLQAGPVFTKAFNRNYSGFSVQPGVYYTSGRFMLGAVPYFARFSDDYQGSFNNPVDQRTDTFTYGGINFQGRYYFGKGSIRPYVTGFMGGSYMSDRLERKPEFGDDRTHESSTINLGLGAGATYRLSNSLLLDIKVEQGFIRHVDFGSWNRSIIPSIGILWKL